MVLDYHHRLITRQHKEGELITGIQHFSFTVSNIDETVHFFRDLLGLQATPILEVKGERIEKMVGMPGAWLRGSNIVTPGNGNIEFIEYVAPKGKKIDLKTCNVGVAHIAFMVDDIQKMYDDLTARGIVFKSPPLWVEAGPHKGWGACYLKGPDGITVELMEAAKGVKLHPATGFVINE
jgi:catechol 2,3-dioxygenase-like lactoylglutathione lyase family enzyme